MDDLGALWMQAMRGGRFDDAWAISDRVLAARDPAGRDDPASPYHLRWVWDGRAFDGRDVLVRCYHGLGDTIQYARYLAPLARRAARVTLEVQPPLARLLAQLPGIDRIVPFDQAHPLPPADCDIEITELPFALRLSPAELPPPYLTATPADLPPGITGLCYTTGNWEIDRRIPPALLAPLCSRGGWLSLVPEPTTLPVLNPDGCSFDIAATAATIAALDRVVTVDTMVVHLAGAMGRPTWLLLKAEPDWRWDPASRGSIWYPSVRTVIQPSAGDWTSVIRLLDEELAAIDRMPSG
jgi:hypothetical protein